jgi:type IV pilus assembly protein PilB
MLVKAGLITQEALTLAKAEKSSNGGHLASNLIKLGYISDDALAQFLSSQFRVPIVDLSQNTVDPSALSAVNPETAHRYEVIPIKKSGRKLMLAMSDPTDVNAIEDIRFHTNLEIEPVVAKASNIKNALEQFYPKESSLTPVTDEMESGDIEVMEEDEEDVDISQLATSGKSAPVTKLVNYLITDAVRLGASDIHIEPYEKIIRVRFRVDGVLQEMMVPPQRLKGAIVSRLKIMANLDIAERRIPQDGRIKLKVRGKMIDLRVSIIPTIFGEKVVMRILDQSGLMVNMNDLGFEEEPLRRFHLALEETHGILLVTGPTGSGKSTTLYSALSRLNTPNVHILTVEDPIEYNLKGINQVQVHEDIGLSFAGALRAFLRQSPNIIMVGEIRDTETAEIAIRAALTGHLVLSTIHTNDAPSTINRLIDMSIEPFLVAAALNLIQAQRLMRKICTHCREPEEVSPRILQEAGISVNILDKFTPMHGKGCAECNTTGYKGRIAATEVLPITPEIRELILKRSSTANITKIAREQGMSTLRDDAMIKLEKGVTTIQEVIRTTAMD